MDGQKDDVETTKLMFFHCKKEWTMWEVRREKPNRSATNSLNHSALMRDYFTLIGEKFKSKDTTQTNLEWGPTFVLPQKTTERERAEQSQPSTINSCNLPEPDVHAMIVRSRVDDGFDRADGRWGIALNVKPNNVWCYNQWLLGLPAWLMWVMLGYRL
jgi:hypothetical protein